MKFQTWEEVMQAAREGRLLRYQAPMDYQPIVIDYSKPEPGENKLRVKPWGKDVDAFYADCGHLDRFSRAEL